MPDVREVYEMVTKQKPPEPGALERQQKRQVRAARTRRFGAFAVAAVIGVVAVVLIMTIGPGARETQPADEPSVVADPSAMVTATGFVSAFDSFDAERASSFLADDVDLSDLSGLTPRKLPAILALLQAQGYEEIPGPCEVTGVFVTGTVVHCPFDFHAIRSDDMGLGPFHGSFWDITVHDGRIVDVVLYWEIAKFSPQVWEPFAEWVSQTHPDDVTKMYTDAGHTDWRLTEDSIRLWGERSREYVQQTSR